MDFLPCVFSSGGGIGAAAKKIIDTISVKMAGSSMDKANDIKKELKTDLNISLIKSQIQSILSSKNSVENQLYNFRLATVD